MLAGRSAGRVARLEAALDVALAVRLDARAVDFPTLDLRLDRFEITVSPPHPQGALQEASKQLGADPAPIRDRIRQWQGGAGQFLVSATLWVC
jgi:hypothetical protein